MIENLNKLEKQFFIDGFRLGTEAAESVAVSDNLIISVQKMYGLMDEFIQSFLQFANENNQSVDCKRGCSWCCYQPVFALNYELLALNKFIQQNFDEQTQSEIKKRAAAKQKRLEKLSGDKLLNSKFPCPLLKDGYCMAYGARPMACRIYLSKQLDTCLKFYNSPDDKNNFPALLQLPMRVGRLMNEGFKSGLKSKNWVVKEFRIEEGLPASEQSLLF